MKTRMRSVATLLFLTTFLFISSAHSAQAAICTWTGGNGDWNDPVHWSCGHVPLSGDDATINDGSTVTVSGSAEVGSLTLSNGTLTGAGALTAGTINWDGGTMSGIGSTTATSFANFTSSNVIVLNDRTFNNAGAATWTKTGYLGMNPAAIFNNQAGATFTIQTTGTYVTYWQGTFNNYGTLNLTTGNIIVTTFKQEAGGITNLAIRGTTPDSDYSQLNASDFYLTGPLNISFTGGYTPQVSDHFILLWDSNSRTGDFSPVNITPVAGVSWNLTYEGKYLHLRAMLGLRQFFIPIIIR
jgi:hypothetical protein